MFGKGHKTNVGRPSPFKGKKAPERSGQNHWNWKGGKQTKQYGYLLSYAPNHPFATTKGYVLEHRLVMEKIVGRYLGKNEIVHHINGIRNDNRPENLKLVLWGRNWHPQCCPKCNFNFVIK